MQEPEASQEAAVSKRDGQVVAHVPSARHTHIELASHRVLSPFAAPQFGPQYEPVLVTLHVHCESRSQGAAVVWRKRHLSTHVSATSDWHMADAMHVARSPSISEHLVEQRLVSGFHWQSE